MVLLSLLSAYHKPLLVSASVISLAFLLTATASSDIHSSPALLSSSPSALPTTATTALFDPHNLTAMTTAASLSSLSSSDTSPSFPSSAASASSASSASFLSSFFSSLCLIFMAEFGDKTFLSTLFLSSSLPASKSSVFSAESLTLLFGSNAAAATLAVLSAVLSSVSSSVCTSWGLTVLRGVASAACVFFGLQMLYDTYRDSCNSAEQSTPDSTVNNTPSSPSSASTPTASSISSAASSTVLSLFIHTYLMSLATELGDHSQFSFLLLTSHPSASALPIVLGGVLGHVLCTLMAIVGGGWIVRLGWHERHIRWLGGGLFLSMALLQVVW